MLYKFPSVTEGQTLPHVSMVTKGS
jgi:hypothetical protein